MSALISKFGKGARVAGRALAAQAGSAALVMPDDGEALVRRWRFEVAGELAELGLGHRLTFGAELGRGEVTHEALVFLRYTLTPDDARMQLAVDFGAGQRRVAGNEDATLLRLGLSLGRGFALDPPDWLPLPVSGGWMALDGTVVQDLTAETTRWKVEATLGLTACDRHSLMLQLVAEEWPGQDVTWGINPSFVFALGAATSLELGLRATFLEDAQYGLELGLWHRF